MTCLACDAIHASSGARRDLFAAAFAQGVAAARTGHGKLEPLCPACAGAVREAMRVIAGVEAESAGYADIGPGPDSEPSISDQIRAYEQRYEMTSDRMRELVAQGVLDTADTARWLILLGCVGNEATQARSTT